jgi:hypothetical protein
LDPLPVWSRRHSLLLANAGTIVVAQVPVARFAVGWRRAVMMAVAALLFVAACLLVIAAGTAEVPLMRSWSRLSSWSVLANAASR